TLVSGEVAFDIHHENDRPFVVTAGERKIRVLGTEFNVMRQNGAFAVTVRRGLVAVSTTDDPARPVRLHAGDSLTHAAGASADKLSVVSADDMFAWRTGKLIYADRPLVDVASDLSRYIGVPVEVAPEVRALRITGVLKVGDETSLRNQVEALLPVKVKNVPGGLRLIAARPGR
ncbi:MAG: FecR domain-containing protein, partial [Novosphingobium sp.]